MKSKREAGLAVADGGVTAGKSYPVATTEGTETVTVLGLFGRGRNRSVRYKCSSGREETERLKFFKRRVLVALANKDQTADVPLIVKEREQR